MRDNVEPSPFQLLSRSALPLILRGFVIAGLQFFAKRAIIAQEGESQSATFAIFSGIEGLIFILVFRGFRIISSEASKLYALEIKAQNAASKNNEFKPLSMGILYRQGVLFGCTLMLVAAFFCISAPFIFRLTKQSDDVLKNSIGYFFFGFFGYLADMLYRSRARIDIGCSKPMSALIGDIVESVIDVVGTYLLVGGRYGFPKMGVNGASLAYAIAATITAAGYNFRAYMNPDFDDYKLYNFSLGEFKNTFFSSEFKVIAYGGLQTAFKFAIVNISVILTTYLCSLSGNGALVGLQAAGAYGYLVSLPIGGFSEAANVVVGRFLKKNWNEACRVANATILIGFIFSCVCGGILFLFSDPIAKIFMSDDLAHAADFQVVKTFLRTQAIMEPISSIGNTGASMLLACSGARRPFLLTLAFTLVLNSTLSVAAYFATNQNAQIMYAIQIMGLILTSSGVLMTWKQQENKQEVNEGPISVVYQANHSIWKKMQLESPRHVAVDEFLPA